MTETFATGALVDITIPGAEVVDHGPTRLTIAIPGLDGTYVLPTRDTRAREVLEIERAVPRLRAGELYLAAGQPDRRLFAVYNPHDDAVLLVDPTTGRWHLPAEAVEAFGTLRLSVPMPEPVAATVRATAALPVLQGPVDLSPTRDPVP
jgi:hypothetical protein